MLEARYIKSIREDGVIIPDHEAINRDLDKDFTRNFRIMRDLYPESGYSFVIYGNGEKLKDK